MINQLEKKYVSIIYMKLKPFKGNENSTLNHRNVLSNSTDCL